jgi:translation elongation factor EF-1beta
MFASLAKTVGAALKSVVGESGEAAPPAATPPKAALGEPLIAAEAVQPEVDAAIFEVYPRAGFDADAIVAQVTQISFPGHRISVGEVSVEDVGFGIKMLRVAVEIKHLSTGHDVSTEAVEVALKNLQVGNHSCVASTRLDSVSKVVF